MDSQFKSNLRLKSSEQLMNMAVKKESWNTNQYLLILEEINNRDLIFDNEEGEFMDEGSVEFLKDMQFIDEVVESENRRDKYQTLALVFGVVIAFIFAFNLFGGIQLFRIENRIAEAFQFVFFNYLVFIILWFFALWALFLGKKYLLSIVVSISLLVFIALLSFLNY